MQPRNIKRRRTTTHVIVAVISFAASAVIVWAAITNSGRPNSQAGEDESNAKSVEKLNGLRQKYVAVRSVHIMAEAEITVYGPNFRAGTGSYEYWAEGDRYRMKCHTDRQLGFLPDVDVAFDGERFYFFDRASRILSYQVQDVAKTTGALPNPLFMPVDFLSIDDDDCHFCSLRWVDFKSYNTGWNKRASNMQVKSKVRDESTGNILTDLEGPGGTKAKRVFKIHVRIEETPDGKVHPTRIDHVDLDGRLLTSITFENFMQSALGEFPRTINLQGFDENSNLVARMIYTVKALEIDQSMKKSIFTIGFDEAEGVWDSDSRRFVKERQPKPPRH